MVETLTPKETEILKEDLDTLEENSEDKKENKIEELTKQLQRLQAEFQNFQKRTEKEKIQIKQNANEDLILKILPIMDNFELSLKHNKDAGVKMIYDEMKKVLKSQGLKKIQATTTFDPKFHEAIIQVKGEPKGKIIEELQKGYLLNDKLLRASKVKITSQDK